MGPKDVIRKSIEMGDNILKRYVNDLSDDELKLVAVEGMHPIALQLGHLIGVERWMLEKIKPGASPELPAGFEAAHDIKAENGDASRFATRDEYVKLWDAQHAATLAVLESIPDSELDDNRDGTLPPFAPTVGVLLNITGLHALSHVGQFVAVRRLLKKPIVF